MNCPCGAMTGFFSHTVKTLAKAQEWLADATESDLPVRIDRDVCPSCGRERAQIFDRNNVLMEVRG